MSQSTTLKRKAISISDKIEICNLVLNNTSYTSNAFNYHIGKSTISAIAAKEKGIREIDATYSGNSVSLNRKTWKNSNYPQLDTALFLWVRQMREKKHSC